MRRPGVRRGVVSAESGNGRFRSWLFHPDRSFVGPAWFFWPDRSVRCHSRSVGSHRRLAVAARAGRFERSAVLLPALHVLAALILIELGDASPGREFRDALIETPWPMAAWSLLYVAGQVALWRYLRGTVRHLFGRWITAGRL